MCLPDRFNFGQLRSIIEQSKSTTTLLRTCCVPGCRIGKGKVRTVTRRQFLNATIAVIGVVGLYTVWSFAAPHFRRTLSPNQVELVLATDKPVYTIGEHPKIVATLTNRSGRTIALVPAIDGSGGRRYPLVKLDVQPPSGALPEEVTLGCGNVNALRPEDFHTVRANEHFDVLGERGGAAGRTALNRGPGEYTIQLTYDTNETDVDRWMGGPLALPQDAIAVRRTSALLGGVPRFTVTSNARTIRFDNPNANAEDMLRNGAIEQGRLALRMAEAGEAIENLPGALTDSIVKNADWDNWEFQSYLTAAMKHLCSTIGEDDLARFWSILSLESRSHAPRSFFGHSPNNVCVLRMAPRCPGPNREGRLRDLLEYRVTKTRSGGESRGKLVKLEGECPGALFAESGEDIDRVLRDLLDSGRLDNYEFVVIKREVQRRGLDMTPR